MGMGAHEFPAAVASRAKREGTVNAIGHAIRVAIRDDTGGEAVILSRRRDKGADGVCDGNCRRRGR